LHAENKLTLTVVHAGMQLNEIKKG